MQKFFAVILFALLLLPMTTSYLTDGSMRIIVEVPTEHTITIKCGSGGKIVYSEKEFTGTNQFKVKRLDTFTASAVPFDGYVTEAITGETNNVTQVGNDFSVTQIHFDESISVTFRKTQQSSGMTSVPVVGKDQTMSAEASIFEDTARITVNEEKLEYLLNQDTGASTITVDFSEIEQNINAVHIPRITVDAIQLRLDDENHGMTEFEVKMQDISISFNSNALTSIFGQTEEEEITVRVEQVSEFETAAVRDAAAEAGFTDDIIIVKVTMYSGVNPISDFIGGNAKITVPYTLLPGEDASSIAVWYIAMDGTMEHVPCVYEDGFVSFSTDHFSKFVVKPGVVANDRVVHCLICRWFGDDIQPWCILLPILIVLFPAGTVVLLIYRKKRKARRTNQ